MTMLVNDWLKCDQVDQDPGTASGALVFRGTGVPVAALVKYLRDGYTAEDFCDRFTAVSRAQARAVLRYDTEYLERRPEAAADRVMHRPIAVRALERYRIWIRFADGTEGEIDLSDWADKPLFAAWSDPRFFRNVSVGWGNTIMWDYDMDLSGDNMYLELTGLAPEELFPLSRETVYA